MLVANSSVIANSDADWHRVCPEQQFCFKYPPDLQLIPQQAIDSLTGLYQSEGLQLVYDLGLYSSDFGELNDPVIEATTIDGYAGEVLHSGNVMALRIPAMHDSIRFAMHLEFSQEVDPVLAHKIFDSIEFTLFRKE